MACKGSRPESTCRARSAELSPVAEDGASLVSATLGSVLTCTGRPAGMSKICRIALVSKETVVVRVQLLELRQVLQASIP
jgi:hypothetical protein